MKTIIKQIRLKGCDDPYFYEGDVAIRGDLTLSAVGEIKVYSVKNDDYRYDYQTDEYQSDKDLRRGEKIAEEKGIDFYDMNNWFEIWDYKTDEVFEVCYSYDEAIKLLEEIK